MTSSKLETSALAAVLWDARTMTDVKAVLAEVAKVRTLKWRALGDRPNNNGTIRMASDPNVAFVERVTNGMDAIMDLAHLQHPEYPVVTPREAAERWLHVPSDGLGAMIPAERRSLAERLVVTFRAGDDAPRPTIVVQDVGTGQTPCRGHCARSMKTTRSNNSGRWAPTDRAGQSRSGSATRP